MSAPKLSEISAEYMRLFLSLRVNDDARHQVDGEVAKILAGRERYEKVANRLTNPPWFVIGIIHQLEGDGDFRTHLHNGDPLSARTVNEPTGRPKVGQAPFSWEESAWDALRFDKLDQWTAWDVAGTAYMFERFNGYGYRSREVHSPYLWAGSQHYVRGKFIADGIFQPGAVSRQIGAMVLLHELCSRGEVALRATRA